MGASIRTKKVIRYSLPTYPTRMEALADPSLLENHVPSTWLTHAEIAGAMSLLLAVNNGCIKERSPKQAGPTSQPAAAIVAPIFEHGEGRGVSGCQVIAPPVFLSEEEAAQVISETLKDNRLLVASATSPIQAVRVPPWMEKVNKSKDWISGGNRTEETLAEGPGQQKVFVPDLQTVDGRVKIEFVSREDEKEFQADPFLVTRKPDGTLSIVPTRIFASHQEHHPKAVADWIRIAVQDQATDTTFAAFYDPLCLIDWKQLRPANNFSYSVVEMETAAEAKRLLRLQVLDFVNWLKAQGAI